MLDTLAFGLVEIDRAKEAFRAGSKQYPAGSYVIGMRQPYSAFAKTLLERQHYPHLLLYPGGPPKRPYDVTAQTLPLLMGVAVDTIAQPFEAPVERVADFHVPADRTDMLAASDTDSWRAINDAWKNGRSVYRNPVTGDFRLEAAEGFRPLKQPRVGLYKPWMPSMDEGWTRWLLDNFGFPFMSVRTADIVSGNLNERFDVLVFPEMQPAYMESGYKEGSMPPEFTGGLGDKGAEAIKQFVSRGGTAVFLNNSSDWAIEHLGLAMKNVLAGVPNRDFYAPGSLLNVRAEQHPLNLGMPKEFAIWSEGSPALNSRRAPRAGRCYVSGCEHSRFGLAAR